MYAVIMIVFIKLYSLGASIAGDDVSKFSGSFAKTTNNPLCVLSSENATDSPENWNVSKTLLVVTIDKPASMVQIVYKCKCKSFNYILILFCRLKFIFLKTKH